MSLHPRSPEDFRVEEVPLYPPLGEGEHTFLRVEKRGRTTEDVVRALARACGVKPRDVGYAGRKDRHAVTSQWFSVPALDPERALELPLVDARVLEAKRHPHKLRTGQLRANRFEIVLHDVDERSAGAARSRLEEMVRGGLPNRFGAQRFGRAGTNAELGRAVLMGGHRPRDRRALRFAVSALQAAVFNEALARRPLALGALEAGDVAVVHASGGLFRVDDPAREAPRAADFEISATGPIFGTRALAPGGAVAEREREALEAFGVGCEADWRPPPGLRLRGTRRALRVRPERAALEHRGDSLHLTFELPPGSYATVLLEELLPDDSR